MNRMLSCRYRIIKDVNYEDFIVCTGNTCRSPLAESIAKEVMPNHQFESRGIFAKYQRRFELC